MIILIMVNIPLLHLQSVLCSLDTTFRPIHIENNYWPYPHMCIFQDSLDSGT